MKAEAGTGLPVRFSDWYMNRVRAVAGGRRYLDRPVSISTFKTLPGMNGLRSTVWRLVEWVFGRRAIGPVRGVENTRLELLVLVKTT